MTANLYLGMALLALSPGLCKGLLPVILTFLNIFIPFCRHLKDVNGPVPVT